MLARRLVATSTLLLVWLVSTTQSSAFAPPPPPPRQARSSASRQLRQSGQSCRSHSTSFSTSSALWAVVTPPIGPFCIFRSPALIELDPHVQRFPAAARGFDAEIQRATAQLVLALQQLPDTDALPPDPLRQELLRISRMTDESIEFWLSVKTRWQLSQDFQLREYGKLTEATLARQGETIDSMASVMRWKAEDMRAMANGVAPPIPSRELVERMNKLALIQQQQLMKNRGIPSISAMSSSPRITASPFDSPEAKAVLESPAVQDEVKKLLKDHESLILFGGRYGDFDPLGKISFIDEMEKIEDRWDIFFARFRLMGLLNQEYVRQCNDYLNAAGLNEEEFRKLLKEAHDLMRQEAERERV